MQLLSLSPELLSIHTLLSILVETLSFCGITKNIVIVSKIFVLMAFLIKNHNLKLAYNSHPTNAMREHQDNFF
jgi:hypothetical protein